MRKVLFITLLFLVFKSSLFAQFTQIAHQNLEGGSSEGFYNYGSTVLSVPQAGGLYVTSDNGKTWSYSGKGLDTFSNSIRFVSKFNNVFYCLMNYNAKVYKSSDGGKNWSKAVFTGLPKNGYGIRSLSASSSKLLLLVDHYNMIDSTFIYYSTNGTAFTKGAYLGNMRNSECKFLPMNNAKAYFFRQNDLCHTTDGINITIINHTGLPNTGYHPYKSSIAGEPNSDNIYCLQNGIAYKYNFSLSKWENITKSPIPAMAQVDGIYATDIALFCYAFDFTSGFNTIPYRSIDKGNTWKELKNTGITMPIFQKVFQISGATMVGSTMLGEMVYSSDTGSTWKIGNTGYNNNNINNLVSIGTKLFTSISMKGVVMSADSGATWQIKNKGLPYFMNAVVFIEDIQALGNNLYAIAEKNPDDSMFIFKSTDAGENWKILNTPYGQSFLFAGVHGNSMIIRAANKSQYDSDVDSLAKYYITSDGVSWTDISTGFFKTTFNFKKVDGFFGNGTHLYLSARTISDASVVYYSPNNGLNWYLNYSGTAYSSTKVKSLKVWNTHTKNVGAFIPATNNPILVFTNNYYNEDETDSIFRNSGSTWTPVSLSGLPKPLNIQGLKFNNGYWYLSCSHGVYASKDLTTWHKLIGSDIYTGSWGRTFVFLGENVFLSTFMNGIWKTKHNRIALGNDQTVCSGDSVELTATGPDSSFSWCCSLGNKKTVKFKPVNQNYTASAFDIFGIQTIDTVKVIVGAKPIASFTINDTVQCFYNNLFVFTNSSTGASKFSWSFGDGATSSSMNPTHSYSLQQTFEIKLVAESALGCKDSVTHKVYFTQPPLSEIIPGSATTFCEGDFVTLYANSGSNYNYQWVKDGADINGETKTFYSTGISGEYTLKVTDKTTGCSSTSASVKVIVNSQNFGISFTGAPRFFTSPPFNVAFDNLTPNKTQYDFTWYFGDNTTSTVVQPFHSYLYNGLFTVMLVAKNKTTGCIDTFEQSSYVSCSGGSNNPCTLNPILKFTGKQLICPGDSVLVQADTGWKNTYQWILNGTALDKETKSFIYAKEKGDYRVAMTNPSCSLTSYPFILSHYATVKPKILANGTIRPCTTDSMELYSKASFVNYLWSTGSATNKIFVKKSGDYYLTITDGHGCNVMSDAYKVNSSFMAPPELCVVTVDPVSRKNLIAWERPKSNLIKQYNIYKETYQANIYQKIGSLPYDSISVFIDTASIPVQKSNKYRITLVDTCGTESASGTAHKTIHLSANAGTSGENNLIWSPYEGLIFSSYKIYRGTSAINMTLLDSVPVSSNLNSYTDLTPPTGIVYYMVSIVKNDTCYPNILRGKTNHGPFSQSMSNIKDYNADPGAKYLETTPNSISVDTLAGIVTVYLFTNVPGWTASADQSWITLIAKNIDNILEVNYTANTNASSRTATITLSASGIADVTIPVKQDGTSGLQETGSASSIIVYPNPANNEVFIWYSDDYRGGRIEISDMSGKRIKTIENISGNVIRIPRNEIADGIYFVRITGQNNWNGKIIFR